jgi:uncharacterized protein (UPF0147 family)
MLVEGETTMPEQFENPETTKLEDETVSDATAKKRIDRVAEKAAEKVSNTLKSYDKRKAIFSK